MTTSLAHRWSIAAANAAIDFADGASLDLPAAWMAALAASRTALLSGDLTTVEIYLDGELQALYEPAHDERGTPDQVAITADLVEIYQSPRPPRLPIS